MTPAVSSTPKGGCWNAGCSARSSSRPTPTGRSTRCAATATPTAASATGSSRTSGCRTASRSTSRSPSRPWTRSAASTPAWSPGRATSWSASARAWAALTEAYRDYPRAPHWADWAIAPDLNPTAGIVALLWKWGIDHPWREAATAFCWEQIDAGLPGDAHSFGEMLSFLAWTGDRERADAVAAAIRADGRHLGGLRMFRLDPAAPATASRPLHYAPAPDSRWIGLFEPAVIDAHLDALVAAQHDDGGWPISWEPIGPAAERDCRGAETLRALRTLRAFGRLP